MIFLLTLIHSNLKNSNSQSHLECLRMWSDLDRPLMGKEPAEMKIKIPGTRHRLLRPMELRRCRRWTVRTARFCATSWGPRLSAVFARAAIIIGGSEMNCLKFPFRRFLCYLLWLWLGNVLRLLAKLLFLIWNSSLNLSIDVLASCDRLKVLKILQSQANAPVLRQTNCIIIKAITTEAVNTRKSRRKECTSIMMTSLSWRLKIWMLKKRLENSPCHKTMIS